MLTLAQKFSWATLWWRCCCWDQNKRKIARLPQWWKGWSTCFARTLKRLCWRGGSPFATWVSLSRPTQSLPPFHATFQTVWEQHHSPITQQRLSRSRWGICDYPIWDEPEEAWIGGAQIVSGKFGKQRVCSPTIGHGQPMGWGVSSSVCFSALWLEGDQLCTGWEPGGTAAGILPSH